MKKSKIKITVIDYSTSSTYRPKRKSMIVRIGDELNEYHLPKIQHTLYSEIHLFQFYDIVPKPTMPINWNPFSNADGERLLRIFEDVKEKGLKEFVVHCFAGVSRSPAVAIALAWYLGQEEDIPGILELASPNTHVLTIMAKLMGIYEEKKEFIESVNIPDEDEEQEIIF